MTASTREEIMALVVGTLADIAPETDFSTVAPDKPLREQIDIDSFDFLNVIIRLHERLKVDIPEADYGQLATLNSTVDYLAKKCSGGV
jgi:acyl carrier protein